MNNNKKWYERFGNDLFDEYISSGEATAVHIVRDIVNNIDTRNKWIDVISMDTDDYVDDDYYYYDDDHYNFNWIIVELFPRITHPNYKKFVEILPSDDHNTKHSKEITNKSIREENRYITWNAAHNDILAHREKNHHGQKFIVLCRLNKNKNKAVNSEYEYIITAINRIDQKQIDYIIENQDELSEKICRNGKPTLDLLNVPLKRAISKS